jgi:C1A family cysteine protease
MVSQKEVMEEYYLLMEAVNQIIEFDEIDMMRLSNCVLSRNIEYDWDYNTAIASKVLIINEPIPESKDLRENWWKINDQDETGSCVGWATADSVLRWHFVKAKKLEKSELLSVRFIWMAAKEVDEIKSKPTSFIEFSGTTVKSALDITRKYGCVKETLLPFYGNKLYDDSESVFYSFAASYKIASYFNLTKIAEDKIQKWKNWIAAGNGPLLFRLDIDKTWYNANEDNPYLENYMSNTKIFGHAAAIVGYTPTHFIIRNSWGADWGDKGFAYASFAYAEEAFTEVYGICVV